MTSTIALEVRSLLSSFPRTESNLTGLGTRGKRKRGNPLLIVLDPPLQSPMAPQNLQKKESRPLCGSLSLPWEPFSPPALHIYHTQTHATCGPPCKMQQNPVGWPKMCRAVLSCFSHVWLSATPWTVARQAPLSMGFSRQEYLSLLPCPLPGDLPNPGFEPESLTPPALAGRVFTTSTTWLTKNYVRCFLSVQRISFNNDSDSLNFPETCYINYFMAQESCPMALREELNLETKAWQI